MNCTDNANCEDVNFYSGFLDNKPDLETINAWNRDKRFGKAYLDSDLDAVDRVGRQPRARRDPREHGRGVLAVVADSGPVHDVYRREVSR